MTSGNDHTNIDALKEEIWAELEQEHQEREERAQRKADRRKQKRRVEKEKNREADALRAQLRREFYENNGYEERIDPTGRKMYLSPTELENRQRKKGRRRSKKSFNLIDWLRSHGFGDLPVYIGIILLAIITGLLLAK